MINEEQFDGFYVVQCNKCGGNRKMQVPFKKEDKIIVCPICGTKLEDKDIIKKIEKPVERTIWYSVDTESFFDY